MNARDVVESFDSAGWSGPFAPADQARAIDALEDGKVLFFPNLAFAVEPNETAYLNPASGNASRKNISFDPLSGRLGGTDIAGAGRERLSGMIDRFGRQADGLVRALLPRYAPVLDRARTSFRPAEISGRKSTPRHDDRLMHVDAFPTRPLRGRRIFRVFANVATDGVDRRWRVGEPFPDFAGKFFPGLRGPLPGQAALLNLLGLTKGPRSAYDHYMLRLHDAGKLDSGYQANAPQAEINFPPGTAWMCFTDSVLHAAMSGRCALEQTFHLPVDGMARPERSPLRVLERMAERALV